MRLIPFAALLAATTATAQTVSLDDPKIQEALAKSAKAQHEIWERGAALRERADQIEARLKQACDTLFLSKPDETITNPICYDVFLIHGLPR